MRVVAMKNRRAEFGAMNTLMKAGLLSGDLLPYVEIIREGGSYDVARWSELFRDRMLFIDYLRCDVKKYRGHDAEQIKLVYQLNNNLPLYCDKLLGLSVYENVIPVISIREGVDKLTPNEAKDLMDSLRQSRNGSPIAIRIEDFEGYEDVLINSLTAEDYLFYDISEQRLASKVMEHAELNNLGVTAHRGVLCSTRLRDVSNKSYENGSPTSLIDCEGAVTYAKYGYEFYGDYAGLKDNLPTRGGGGQGCALAVLFDANINKFRTYVCDDADLGVEGYPQVMDAVIADQSVLDPDNDCIALETIRSMAADGKTGNWESWIKITLLRTIQQLGKS